MKMVFGALLVYSAATYLATAVKITELKVPELVNIEREEPVILDCVFNAENDTDGLVVKWYFGEQLIYQWIYNHTPQALGILRDKLDLNYTVNDDPYSMHRALKIISLSRSFTGLYMCKIDTYNDEDTKSDTMTVLDPPSSVDLTQEDIDDETMKITCAVYDIFPKPNISLTYTGSSEEDQYNSTIVQDDDGLYNITIERTYNDDLFEGPTKFTCLVTIPNTKYAIEKTLVYYPGFATTTTEITIEFETTTVIPENEDNSGVPVKTTTWMHLFFIILATKLLT